MTKHGLWIHALLASVLLARPSAAGIIDTPLPVVDGRQLQLVFSVTGVEAGSGGLETVFACTSLDPATFVTVAVEIFDNVGTVINDVDFVGSNTVGKGGTRTFQTNAGPAAFENGQTIPVGKISQGSARISASSSRIICGAFLVSAAGAPPVSMASLPVIAKTKQKGD